MSQKTLISIENISKDFLVDGEKLQALSRIDLQVYEGEFLCLVGPSGCGKSTLLRLLTGLMGYDSGKITMDPDTTFSFIFQNFALFPWLTVAGNIGFGMKMAGRNEREAADRVAELVVQMGLEGFENKHPRELSGGMKQRVGIARALSMSPKVLILDEPFSALDTFTAARLRKDLLKIWKQSGLTIVMVSHLIEEAVELADRVVVMDSAPGRIVEVINIEQSRPRELRSKLFFEMVDRISKYIAG